VSVCLCACVCACLNVCVCMRGGHGWSAQGGIFYLPLSGHSLGAEPCRWYAPTVDARYCMIMSAPDPSQPLFQAIPREDMGGCWTSAAHALLKYGETSGMNDIPPCKFAGAVRGHPRLNFSPRKSQALFEAIPEEDLGVLDIVGRPEHLMVTTVSVPPMAIRPSVEMDGASNEDDISMKLMVGWGAGGG